MKGYYFADVTLNAPAKAFFSSRYLLCGKVLSVARSGAVFIWIHSWEPLEQPASIVCYLGEARANNQLTLLATERSPFSPSHYICSHVRSQPLDMTSLINHSSSEPIAALFEIQAHTFGLRWKCGCWNHEHKSERAYSWDRCLLWFKNWEILFNIFIFHIVKFRNNEICVHIKLPLFTCKLAAVTHEDSVCVQVNAMSTFDISNRHAN